MTEKLYQAYNAENFRKQGHALVDLLADHLDQTTTGQSKKTIDWNKPEDELEFWSSYAKESHPTPDFFKTVLSRSIALHHPNYMGHQVSPALPVSALSMMLSGLLNNGSAVYEMGMANTALEKIVVDTIAGAIGFDQEADGILTSGGTLANLTALLCARHVKSSKDVWNDGHKDALAIMVSAEAHYCVDRAAKIMGLGDKGIIKVPVNERYSIATDQLQECYDAAVQKGLTVIAVVGSAPSTSTGMHDDLSALSEFSKKNDLWFHVDGAHGGAAVFSKKYKHLVNGINQADSVVIDGHKMMMTSSIATALVFKNGDDSYKTFQQKADYLWGSQQDKEWYTMAKRTFECTKSMMALRFYSIINEYGTAIFDDYVTTCYDQAKVLAGLIEERSDMELFLPPDTNIICFRYIDAPSDLRNELNKKIRSALLNEGTFYIVETTIREIHYLRVTVMNPFSARGHFNTLLDQISKLGHHFSTQREGIK
ncbi:aspartate aminotransferase family protein [Gangjinia marincola]|uniref:Aspartate aminotransferase family protein n=1 Tax=Gangjinia marincola TaxID=578463 RepID=A0ABP3XRQ6_9FLAO